jgi:hypothetical protein
MEGLESGNRVGAMEEQVFIRGRACHGYEYFFSIIKVIFCGLLLKI